jgi:AbrB family looped-hinge helix DNA binding protein
MSKVTSKLQVTIPKAVAEQHGVREGSEVVFESAGGVIRMTPVDPGAGRHVADLAWRLRLFDSATERQRRRQVATRGGRKVRKTGDRGWTREEAHDRGVDR